VAYIYKVYFTRNRVTFSVSFTAGVVRSQLRAAGICQDCDVHVDVHRGFISAQHGDRYVLEVYTHGVLYICLA